MIQDRLPEPASTPFYRDDFYQLWRAPWPGEGAELEIAEILHQRLVAPRRVGNPHGSVQEETRIADFAHDVVEEFLAHPKLIPSISPVTVGQVQNQPGYRAALTWAMMVRSSYLWPVSRLLYGWPDLQEVTCSRHHDWIAITSADQTFLEPNPYFDSDDRVIETVRNILLMDGVQGDKSLTAAHPIAEATIGPNYRLAAMIKPVRSGDSGVALSIRLLAPTRVQTLDEYVSAGAMTAGMKSFIEAAVEARLNLMVTGGTKVGKTTFLRPLCRLIKPWEQVVVIEDTAELHLDRDRGDGLPWVTKIVSLATKSGLQNEEVGGISLAQLVKSSLRLSPNRVILGEARDEAMAEVAAAMQTGHDGCMVTLHAEDAVQALARAAFLTLGNERVQGNEQYARALIGGAIHLVIHLGMYRGQRKVSGIVAVDERGYGKPIYQLQPGGGYRCEFPATRDLGDRIAYRLLPLIGEELPR